MNFQFFCSAYCPGKGSLKLRQRTLISVAILCGALLFPMALLPSKAQAHEDTQEVHSAHGNMSEVGAKLANPLSDLWSLQFNFEALKFYDGDVNEGNPRIGSGVVFQPVLPIPLYGSGDAEWRMVTRPVIPVIFSQPVPKGFDSFRDKGGIGDIQLPLMVNIPSKYSGNWLLGAGPVGMFPTATTDALGSDQFAAGPAVVFGYKTKKWIAVLFPNYFWKIGSHGQDSGTSNINQGSLLYMFNYNLANAWQIGTNPTITYNNQASGGNKWNVPVGGYVGKTIKVGNTPLNLKFGLEHSVVSEDDFGKRTVFRIQITPVIKGLISSPIFGGAAYSK
jgi:hypothetical protein